MHRRAQREFDAFVSAVGDRLLHTAELLTGDPERAERRVGRALARTYLKWRQATELDPTRIAYRALLAGYLDPWRPLPWRPVGGRQPAFPGDDAEVAALRTGVLRGLDRLTRVERAVTVLRAYAHLDTFDTAEVLGVSEETTEAAFARAGAMLRRPVRETVTWTAGVGVHHEASRHGA